jgi:hypothetical protein
MTTNVYLADSFPWLSRQLLTGQSPDARLAVMVPARSEADLIVYPKTDKEQVDAGDRLRDFSPSELLRTCVFSQLDEPFPWAPGVYASVPARYAKHGGFTGGFYVAQHHHEEGGLADDLEEARSLRPDLLWSFVGTAGNHPVRQRLMRLADERSLVRDTRSWSERVRWNWKTEHRDEARKVFSGYAEQLGRSQFVVCPRGRGAGSIRLFEALRVGRAPVIISDDWLAPPFVDWGSCSVRVAERDVGRLPQLLREREPEAAELGERARMVWERWYAPERQLSTLVASCLLAAESAPSRPLLVARASLRPRTLRRSLRGMRNFVGRVT